MISPKQIKAARIFLSFDQRDLARISGLSLPTIQRMEKIGVERSSVANAQRLQQALEAAGVEFIAENGGGAGVRLRRPASQLDAASPPPFAETIAAALNTLPAKAEEAVNALDPAPGATQKDQ